MEKITFGRSQDCDVVINAKEVSRKHGYLCVNGSIIYIVDTNSANGIYVNGIRINNKTKLSHNDRVTLSKNVLFDWEKYVPLDSATRIVSNETMRYYQRDSNNSRPYVDIPSKMDINVSKDNKNVNISADVNINGEDGADWKVPFKRNVGNIVGNAVGCVIAIVIFLLFLFILGMILS